MRTVQPSIIVGSYVWDQDRLPRDEFQIRVAALNRVMDEHGWKAVLIYGDADQHSALAYFSNFVPRLRWGMALLPRDGEPRLLASMSSRDVPAMKLMTWIPDVLSGWTWESAFDPWLAKLSAPEPIDIGTVGFDLMRPVLMNSLEKSLGNRFRLRAADAAVAACRTVRPREVSQMREASRVVQAAGAAFVQAWQQGIGIEAAALEGERCARLMAAQDVRTLMSFDGGRTLSPGRGTFEQTSGSLVGYIAVKHMGYWAEMFVSASGAGNASDTDGVHQCVRAALDAVLRAAGPDVGASTLYATAMEQLGPHALHRGLSASIGRRIGLTLNEGGDITCGSGHTLAPGDVYALHVGTHDPAAGGALVSAMIVITANGTELLHRSPEPPHP
jgi:Xaa-Pro aminopeptidase